MYHRFRSLESEAQRVIGDAHVKGQVDPDRLRQAVRERRGVPVDVTGIPLRPRAVLTQSQPDVPPAAPARRVARERRG